MKERPILFSAPMVRAILEGRKTVTRRVMKPQPENRWVNGVGHMLAIKKPRRDEYWLWPNAREQVIAECPYGQPGDRLWVRETFMVVGYGGFGQSTGTGYESFETIGVEFAAGGDPSTFDFLNGKPVEGTPETVDYAMAKRMSDSGPEGNRPCIHMPRWASRITLEVTGVRVERLHDISEQQAYDEGVNNMMCAAAVGKSPYKAGPVTIMGFAHLWESIGGAGSWDANPWVWVVEFRRLTP